MKKEKTNLRDDELVREKTDSWQGTIHEKGNSSDRIDCGVDVCKPFKPL